MSTFFFLFFFNKLKKLKAYFTVISKSCSKISHVCDSWLVPNQFLQNMVQMGMLVLKKEKIFKVWKLFF